MDTGKEEEVARTPFLRVNLSSQNEVFISGVIDRARKIRFPDLTVTELNKRGYGAEFRYRRMGVRHLEGSEHGGEIKQPKSQNPGGDRSPADPSPVIEAGK